MPTPSLKDDGSSVTLDLHGMTVDEAIDLTFHTLYLAEERGRTQLKLIHGSSTSRGGSRRTIKRALYELIDEGSLGTHATDIWRARDYVVLTLDLTAARNPTPIRLSDVYS